MSCRMKEWTCQWKSAGIPCYHGLLSNIQTQCWPWEHQQVCDGQNVQKTAAKEGGRMFCHPLWYRRALQSKIRFASSRRVTLAWNYQACNPPRYLGLIFPRHQTAPKDTEICVHDFRSCSRQGISHLCALSCFPKLAAAEVATSVGCFHLHCKAGPTTRYRPPSAVLSALCC